MGEITKNRRPKVSVSSDSGARERLKAHARRNAKAEMESERLILCLDASGSMRDAFEKDRPQSPSKIEALKKAAFALVDGSDHQHCMMGAVQYSSKVVTLSELTRGYEALKDRISKIHVEGGTFIGDGLDHCTGQLGEGRFGTSRIILVSDGREGIYDKERASPVIVKQVVKPAGIVVDCVAIGHDADNELLQWIAKQTGGVFLHPKTPEDLSRNFLQLEMRNRKLLTAGD